MNMTAPSLLVFASLLFSAAAQTCTSEVGPCVSGGCSVPGATCITATGSCCAAGGLTNCVDLLNPKTGVSDCPVRAYLCSDSVYYSFMTTQCPKTCGRCNAGK